MKCPFCSYEEHKVIDSRPVEESNSIRRRRECLKCQKRFTTYERVESISLIVIKKDGTREEFNREKIMDGIVRACQKRPVSVQQMENVVNEIEHQLANSLDREVTTNLIGEMVMQKLKEIDEVSYVRFASVYRQFKDINTFMEELKKLLS